MIIWWNTLPKSFQPATKRIFEGDGGFMRNSEEP
jgi:hypothetical protein